MVYTDLDILFLTTKEIPDYLQDAVYMGLCELGCNVVDNPRRKSLHGSWYSEEYRVEQLLFHYPEKELRKNPDLLIITGMYGNYNYCKTYGGWSDFVTGIINNYKPEKIIMLDAEDSVNFSYPVLEKGYDAVFKRELFKKIHSNWYNISFSAIPEPFQYIYYPYRKYDISFIATLSNPYRVEVKELIEQKAKELGLSIYMHVDKTPIKRQDFLNVLSQSKTSVSVRGAGCDCYRYWEIPAKGLVMIADDQGLPIENDYTSEQIFKFKNLNELEQILLKLKSMLPESLDEMAVKSLWHTIKYHTPKKRAEYILKKVYNVS
jgi:hypothetical protein